MINLCMGVSFEEKTTSLFSILDSLSLPAFIIDSAQKIVSFNGTARILFHYRPDELAGRKILEIFPSDGVPDNVSAAWPEAAVGMPHRQIQPFEAECRKKNGEPFISRISVVPYSGDNHRLVVIQDISEQRRLVEENYQLEFLNELGSIINSSLSIGTIFRIVFAEIRKMVSYERGSLLLFDEDENTLIVLALDTSLPTGLRKGAKIPLENTSTGWVARNNRAWINYDLADGARFSLDAKLLAEGIRSTISVPIYRDRILGVFNLDGVRPQQYSTEDLDLLMPVAKHLSIALENALLFEDISKEKREWEKTFDAITDMVWIEDGKQRVIRANSALLGMTDFPLSEISHKYCWQLLERIGIPVTENCLCADTICTNKPSFRELQGKDGNIFHFWAYPLTDEEGRLYAVVHYLKDVTSRIHLEQHLVRSERLASLGTLVAGIAHEINNPLGIISGYAEALLDRIKDKNTLDAEEFEVFPEYLETIHKEIFRCKHILRSLLGFASPSVGAVREIDINELIKEVILLVNHRAKRLRHNIKLGLQGGLPKIPAEPGNLRQLFMNIIINSMYFTPEGGVIRISSGIDTDMILVSITDTGAGIRRDYLTKIFDPFFTTKPVGEGTGLGLAICHKIVEEHGGSIDVESELDKGTTFFIRLPVASKND